MRQLDMSLAAEPAETHEDKLAGPFQYGAEMLQVALAPLIQGLPDLPATMPISVITEDSPSGLA